jgi:hypothetical protein
VFPVVNRYLGVDKIALGILHHFCRQ